jgi:hypothetical protein
MSRRFDAEGRKYPKPGEEICDFCSEPLDPKTVWTYRTEPHEIGTWKQKGFSVQPGVEVTKAPDPAKLDEEWVMHQMDEDGFWAACPTCHRLIEADDRRGLIERSLETAVVKARKMLRSDVPAAVVMEIRGAIAQAHAGFFINKKDDAPWQGTPDKPGAR